MKCDHCRKVIKRAPAQLNRTGTGRNFCNLHCFSQSRRTFKPKAQKVAEKRLYDIAYRRKNRKLLKAKKHAYFERTYDPVAAAKVRKARMHLHVVYCRQPHYKRWKKRYDNRYRAGKIFGPYAEAFLVLQKIEREVSSRITNYEVRQINGTLNKTLQRKRAYARLVGNQFKNGPVGNPAGHQGRPHAARAG